MSHFLRGVLGVERWSRWREIMGIFFKGILTILIFGSLVLICAVCVCVCFRGSVVDYHDSREAAARLEGKGAKTANFELNVIFYC